ncbi:uncharacterized protein LOC142974507 [Anticarsia gemmatalis]|uniref:uncharacterized protein LOC142974507 n=1 Tax=Anticarsia gemmatalis TaxID=129554 RepID=UPI003F765A75
MWLKYLFTFIILTVLISLTGAQSNIPIYDVRLKNLMTMQQGIGWPLQLRVVKGLEALLRLSSSEANNQNCEVLTPSGLQFNVNSPPSGRFESWSGGCGVRVKNVESSDAGRWRLTFTSGNNSITGWSELHVEEDTPSYKPVDPISLQDGQTHAEVELTTLQNSYCLVTQPFSESTLVPGHCQVTLDRTTRAVQGRWNVVLGIPGRVSELEVDRNIAVETEQLASGYREDSAKLHLYCNVLHTHKNITFCRFQKNSETSGFNIMDGLSDGRYSYYGDGFKKKNCGMTIETPAANDYITWRCSVGLQEWRGTTVVQSTPMQALIRVPPKTNSASRQGGENDDVRTLFVEKDSPFTIMCRAEASLAYCWFQHPNGSQFTPVERQDGDERDFRYTGDSLQIGDCGITFAHVTDEDVGVWTCHMGPRNQLGVEETDRVNVKVTGPLAANNKEVAVNDGGAAILYCHTSNGRRPLDYCRFLSPNNVGFSIDSSVKEENAILGRFYFTPERSLDCGDCSLTISSVLDEDIGEWTCAGLLHDNTAESKDTLVLYANSKRRQPLSTASIAGMSVGLIVLACVLAGTVWYKKGKPIPWRRVTYSARADNVSLQLSGPRSSNDSSSSNEQPQPRP